MAVASSLEMPAIVMLHNTYYRSIHTIYLLICLVSSFLLHSLKLGAPRPFQLAPAPCCQRLRRTRPWLPIRGREMSGQRMSCFWQKKIIQFWREIQISGDPHGPDPPDGAGAAGVHLEKSGLAPGSFLCIIHLFGAFWGWGWWLP